MCLSVCRFVLVFFGPFGVAVASLGEGRGAGLGAFRAFVRFVLVWVCRFPLPLGVREGLRYVIVALPGLFSYLFLYILLLLFQNICFDKLCKRSPQEAICMKRQCFFLFSEKIMKS